MGRRPRSFVPGIYHFSSHGSAERHLFLDDRDRRIFLEQLELVIERFELGLVAYTLMGNHYHMVLRIRGACVSRALQQLHTWYSRRHNRRNHRAAHLFRAHPFAREIEGDADLLGTCRYLAWNPVEAGLCSDPLAWRWSSIRPTAGLESAPLRLELEPLLSACGANAEWRTRYLQLITERENAPARAA